MKRLYNIGPHPVVVKNYQPAVFPGQPYDFPDDADMGPAWSEKNPREGLAQERAFWARRRAEADGIGGSQPNPAEPDEGSSEQ